MSSGTSSLRIATWNVERVSLRSWKRLPAIRAAMAAVDADLWILTEAREGLSPADGFHALHCPPAHRSWKGADERMVCIWSRWPIAPTDIEPRARGAVSGVVEHPDGPLTVFGSVIPYANDRGADGTARRWESHAEEIERLHDEWQQLTADGTPLVVAGDLNSDRDGSDRYGTRAVRAALGEAFAAADLVCLTEEDVVAAGKLERNHLIDHIAVSTGLAADGWDLRCWEPVADDGTRMSDHPGVAVSLG